MVIDTVMLEHLGQKRQDTKFGLWKTAGAEAATNVWLLKDVRNEEPFYLCIIFIVQQKGAKHKKNYIYMHIIHIFSKTGNSKSSEPKHQNSQTGIPCAANGINRAAWKRKCGGKNFLISGKAGNKFKTKKTFKALQSTIIVATFTSRTAFKCLMHFIKTH